MIEGMHFDVGSDELKDHLNQRAKHHSGRASWYGEQAKTIGEEAILPDGSSKFSNSHSNPVDGLKATAKKHRYLAQKFTFMATHLRKDETYRISESELTTLELVEGQY